MVKEGFCCPDIEFLAVSMCPYKRTLVNAVSILGEMVEIYKYLSVHLYNRLDRTCNTNAIYRKGQSRLYFLRKCSFF